MKQYVIVVERDDVVSLKGVPQYVHVTGEACIWARAVIPFEEPDQACLLTASQLPDALRIVKRDYPSAFVAAYALEIFDPGAVYLRWERERRWPNGELRLAPEVETCRRLHSDVEVVLGREH